MPDFAVIIPAAGSALRFGGPKNKLACDLRGSSVLRRSIAAFLIRKDVKRILVPKSSTSAWADDVIQLNDPRITPCPGGGSRAQSVKNAVLELLLTSSVRPEQDQPIEWVAIHDAARPLVSQALIDATLAAAVEHGAAAPALPVPLTIKEATGPLPAKVQRTIPRRSLWAMQTPQIMRVRDLCEAFEKCLLPLEQVTDDVQLLELAGKEVWLIPGEERNLKITTQQDLKLAELITPA